MTSCLQTSNLLNSRAELLGVEFDDELLVDGLGDVGALGVAEELAGEGGTVPLEPSVVAATGSNVVGDEF